MSTLSNNARPEIDPGRLIGCGLHYTNVSFPIPMKTKPAAIKLEKPDLLIVLESFSRKQASFALDTSLGGYSGSAMLTFRVQGSRTHWLSNTLIRVVDLGVMGVAVEFTEITIKLGFNISEFLVKPLFSTIFRGKQIFQKGGAFK